MGDEERHALLDLGFFYVTYMPIIRENRGMLTILAEKWHFEASSFHLPIGEVIVIIEDVYKILGLPIQGE